jgi:hypothetical protein
MPQHTVAETPLQRLVLLIGLITFFAWWSCARGETKISATSPASMIRH